MLQRTSQMAIQIAQIEALMTQYRSKITEETSIQIMRRI